MNALLTRLFLAPVFTLVLLMVCNNTLAQGTASGPSTIHNVTPGLVVEIGDPFNPFQIDLDPAGPPWTKTIHDPFGVIPPGSGAFLGLIENIQNVGTEPWTDWHEHILPGQGYISAAWTFVDMTINGNPISFNQIGLGPRDLWLDTFSQPVFPGGVLRIRKTIHVFPTTASLPGTPLLTIQEYPTPEPASASLLAMIGFGALNLRQRKLS